MSCRQSDGAERPASRGCHYSISAGLMMKVSSHCSEKKLGRGKAGQDLAQLDRLINNSQASEKQETLEEQAMTRGKDRYHYCRNQ